MRHPESRAPYASKVCRRCGEEAGLADLRRCPVCHTRFCRRCAVIGRGRRFCSRSCERFDVVGFADDD